MAAGLKAPKAIEHNAAIKNHEVEFVMDKECRVTVSDLFREQQTTLAFAVDDDVLDLSCLDKLRRNTKGGNDRFLPGRIFVRRYLQEAPLACRQQRQINFGKPQSTQN